MAVMYAGKIVEHGAVRDLFNAPKHPYTQALLGSMPKLGSKEPLYAIPGQPPDLAQPAAGLRLSPALRPCACRAAPRKSPDDRRCRPELDGAVLARRSTPSKGGMHVRATA